MKVAGFDLGGVRVEVVAEAAGFQFGRFHQGAVKGGEEGFAAVGEGFPGVFAVENERGDAVTGRGDFGDVLEVVDEVGDGLGCFIARGIEADEVGQGAVAEERLEGLFIGVDAPALEKRGVLDVAAVPRGIVLEAFEEVPFVGAEVLKAGLDHEGDDFGGDRSLGGPEAAGAVSEDLLVEFLREAELGADVFRRGEGGGKGRLGLATPRDVGVVDQRHDGVKVGRGRQFDLAPLGGGAVFGKHEAEDLPVDVEDGGFFLLGEAGALLLELFQDGKTAQGGEAAPLEIVKGLEIAEIGLAESADNGIEFLEGVIGAAFGEQFGVTGNGADERVPVDLEKILENMAALLVVEAGRRLAADGFPLVLDLAVDEFEDLADQDGGEVEIDAQVGLGGDEVDHVEIALGGMEPHPGHLGLFRQRIDVIGLVHVPEDDHVHEETSPRRNRAASSG